VRQGPGTGNTCAGRVNLEQVVGGESIHRQSLIKFTLALKLPASGLRLCRQINSAVQARQQGMLRTVIWPRSRRE
jgi:hypothetical protein